MDNSGCLKALSSDDYGPSLYRRIRESLSTICRMKMRSILALLGIVVGCATVIALLNIGMSAANNALSVFKGMGSDLVAVSFSIPMQSKATPVVENIDTNKLLKSIPQLNSIAPLVPTNIVIRAQGQRLAASIIGTSPSLKDVLDLSIKSGRFITTYDIYTTYAVIGNTAASSLSPVSGRKLHIGEQLQLGNYLFEVIGILNPMGNNPILPVSVDDSVFVSVEGMTRLMPEPSVSALVGRGNSSETLSTSADMLRNYLRGLLPDREINVQIPEQLLDGMTRQSSTFTWLLVGLGCISLLVGGVGVMNVMLMNVISRRKEIGIRMAIGARPQDIIWLFLLEAIFLTLTGAIIGTATGLIFAWLFSVLSAWHFSWSPLSIPLGIGISLLTGVFFGLYPALIASKMEPVKALRDE